MMSAEIDEIISFLPLSSRPDVKHVALEMLLDLTGTKQGRDLLCSNETLLKALAHLLEDSQPFSSDALRIFINLASEDEGVNTLVHLSSPSLLELILQQILKTENSNLGSLCVLLNNLSRTESAVETIYNVFYGEGMQSMEKLIDLFCQNERKVSLQVHHLAGYFSNVSQHAGIRRYFFNEETIVFNRFLPFTMFESSSVRRDGIAGLIRNCSIDTEYHSLLLSDKVDVLPHILLPLAGPEEFPDDEMAELPLELQYLGETKQREPNPSTRKKLLEALAQLCATKSGRETLRRKQAYLILRELHKWEKEPDVLFTCENAVQLLIGDEPEPGMANLKDVEIPDDLAKKFDTQDAQYLKEFAK